jgi:hypothetical protein
VDNLTEEQILDQLFETTEKPPQVTKHIKRLGMTLTIMGLMASHVDKVKERCTESRKSGSKTEEVLNKELFDATLIQDATVGLEIKGLSFSGWGDPRLLKRFSASGGEQVVRRVLLAGEMQTVGNVVMEQSGYNTDLDDIKN